MSTALVFFYVKCAFKNIQNLTGVMNKLMRCQTERWKGSCANVCKRTQMIDQIWQKSLANLSSCRKVLQESCHIFKEGNVSFNTKGFLKTARTITHVSVRFYVMERNRNQSIKPTILFLARVTFIHLYITFWFSYVFGVFLQVTIVIELKFQTESSLYMVYLRFTGKKKTRALD